MIRHRPLGRGHPYVVDPDQRFPVRPLAGAAFDLGITTDVDARGVEIELDGLGSFALEKIGEAAPVEDPTWGAAASTGEGHLSGITALAAEPGRVAWRYRHHGLADGDALRYRFVDGDEATPWYEVRPCGWDGDRFGDGELVYALRFTLPFERGWHLIGLGERFDALDQSGRRLQTAVYDQYKGQGGRSYLPVPFAIVAGGGYGFYAETGHRVRVDARRLVLEVDLEPGTPDPSVPLHVFEGSPADVLRQYLELTGEPALPPDWAFRLWMSANVWNTQTAIEQQVDRSFDEGIAPGVVVIEAWSDETTFTQFGDGWPDPHGLVESLHGRGVKVLLWQIPLVRRDAEGDIATMIDRGFCVRDADGEPYGNPGGWFENALLLDVTNEEAVRWWTERRRWLVDDLGVDGFKTDGGEHAWSPELRYADGTRGGETNNRYPVLYAKAYHEQLGALTFSRAGYAGSQLYPAHWAGDQDSTWEALRSCITAGLSAGASGIFFWGFDLGGFSGPLPSAELYLRAAAAAALCPIMQYHSEFGSPERTPWNVAEQTGDARVLPLFRSFVETRERLVPYLVDQARAAVAQRLPLMRALPFVTHDERAWAFPYQWLLGDGLLVAPVVESGVTAHRVFLPRGEWIDTVGGETLRGDAVHELDAPLDRLPVLAAAGFADRLARLFDPIHVEV